MAKRNRHTSEKFTAKKRKELQEHLTNLPETRCSEISHTAIQKVKDSLHVLHHKERLDALMDPNGERFLVNCAKAMCSNFQSFYSTFLPRQRYTEFQQAWFTHIGQYIDGKKGLGTPSSEPKTRSGRRIKDVGKMTRVEASECKHIWDEFTKALASPLPIEEQRILVSALAYAVYDEMNEEVMQYKWESKSDVATCSQAVPKYESEDIIQRYLGFAVFSMMEHKKKQLAELHSRYTLSKEERLRLSHDLQQEIKLLKLMTIKNDEKQLSSAVTHLSQGGLTQVCSEMVMYGGEVLLEFSQVCGTRFCKNTPATAEHITKSERIKEVFKKGFETLVNTSNEVQSDNHIPEKVMDGLFTGITSKIVHARVNEMMKADKELELEASGKVVDTSQSLRDTLKAYSISKQRC